MVEIFARSPPATPKMGPQVLYDTEAPPTMAIFVQPSKSAAPALEWLRRRRSAMPKTLRKLPSFFSKENKMTPVPSPTTKAEIFDPTKEISLEFLQDVPTYRYESSSEETTPTQTAREPSPDRAPPPVPHKSKSAGSVHGDAGTRKVRSKIVRPIVEVKSILKVQSKYSCITPPQHIPPTPNLSPSKSFRFNEQVLVGETYPKEDYERRSDFMLSLTPEKAYLIKKELNDYKREEMNVHETSRCFTHFFV